jgi:two-component system sensor histidine kinase RegB
MSSQVEEVDIPSDPEAEPGVEGVAKPAAATGRPAGLSNMRQLIQLRWLAVGGQVVTIAVVHFGFGIALPIREMGAALACLVLFNALSRWRWRGLREASNSDLLFGLLVDAAVLTAQLHFSGGATNPFAFLFLLQVILGAVLLSPGSTWFMVGVTSACFVGLSLFSPPLLLAPAPQEGLASRYVQGLLICFLLNASLLTVFIKRINLNLRAREARLADLRQRAAEEEHIVRMGLLASGAAHELGTPLSTLAVILGDWQHMPAFTNHPELAQELAEMQAQVQRCKRIVSGILLSAGEARGEVVQRTTVCRFLDGLVEEWRARHPQPTLVYDNRFGQDLPMVSDSALQQMICNVLDNAFEASPHWIHVELSRDAGWLLLSVSDAGPGFAPAMLAPLGKPYQSSKGRAGGGLGLFLAVNVARTLGGRVQARNRSEGGACVSLSLPLAAITLSPDQDHGR